MAIERGFRCLLVELVAVIAYQATVVIEAAKIEQEHWGSIQILDLKLVQVENRY